MKNNNIKSARIYLMCCLICLSGCHANKNDIEENIAQAYPTQINIDTPLPEKQKGMKTAYSIVKDTLLKIDGKQLYEKISIIEIENKFVVHEFFDKNGKNISKLADNQVQIVMNDESFIFTKNDIPQLDTIFVRQSIFQNIFFKEISLEKSTFEIIFGVPDSDNIILIYLSINSKREREIVIDYLEED
jgi:hypothetical protein